MIQELKARLGQGTQISGAIATPEPSSPAPAKQHHKAFRSAGTVALTLSGQQGQTVCYSLRYRYLGAGCHRDAYMVSDLRHPEDEFNRLVMKVSNSHDRSMQEDICCINAVRDQAPSLAKFFPEMLAYLPHMTCRGIWKESSHCLLLQTAMGDGQSVARRAAELTQQELYVQAALVMMQGGLFLLNVQEAASDNANGQLITDLRPANIVVTKRLEGGRRPPPECVCVPFSPLFFCSTALPGLAMSCPACSAMALPGSQQNLRTAGQNLSGACKCWEQLGKGMTPGPFLRQALE